MKRTEDYNDSYMSALLVFFLFGSLITLLYLPGIQNFLPENKLFIPVLMALIIFISSLFSSSYDGLIFLPVCMLAFGCAAAIEADEIRLACDMGRLVWKDTLPILIMTPLQFSVSSWGMRFSAHIRDTLNSQHGESKASFKTAYFIKLVGAVVFTLSQVLMLI